MKKENVLKSCYSVLGKYTPLVRDCGKICGGKCCDGDENTGMILFPGEEALIDSNIEIKKRADGVAVAVCNGTCDRRKRPLSCRIYPLFPVIIRKNGKELVETDFDRRADCPLISGEAKLNRRFCNAVRRVGKYLLLNDETAELYRSLCEEQNELMLMEKIFLKK